MDLDLRLRASVGRRCGDNKSEKSTLNAGGGNDELTLGDGGPVNFNVNARLDGGAGSNNLFDVNSTGPFNPVNFNVF